MGTASGFVIWINYSIQQPSTTPTFQLKTIGSFEGDWKLTEIEEHKYLVVVSHNGTLSICPKSK